MPLDNLGWQEYSLKIYECCNAPTQLNATTILQNIMFVFQHDIFSLQILHLYPQDHHINVHKVVMAACSKFFKDQLCKVNVQVIKFHAFFWVNQFNLKA